MKVSYKTCLITVSNQDNEGCPAPPPPKDSISCLCSGDKAHLNKAKAREIKI